MFGADYIVLYLYSMALLNCGLGILEYKGQKHQANKIKGDSECILKSLKTRGDTCWRIQLAI